MDCKRYLHLAPAILNANKKSLQTVDLKAFNLPSGQYWIRTNDPFHVKEIL